MRKVVLMFSAGKPPEAAKGGYTWTGFVAVHFRRRKRSVVDVKPRRRFNVEQQQEAML